MSRVGEIKITLSKVYGKKSPLSVVGKFLVTPIFIPFYVLYLLLDILFFKYEI